jgi:hypothetical protein
MNIVNHRASYYALGATLLASAIVAGCGSSGTDKPKVTTPTFAAETLYGTTATPGRIQPGDFNDDGNTDLVTLNIDSTLSVLLGDGKGGFGAPLQTPAIISQGSPFNVVVADFNGDGRDDAGVVVLDTADTLNVMLANPDGTLMAPVGYAFGGINAFFVGVAVGDFNNDNVPDVAIAAWKDEDDIGIFIGRGDGTFEDTTFTDVPNAVGPVVVGDFNDDGNDDLGVATGNSALIGGNTDVGIGVLMGNGNGTFDTATTYKIDSDSIAVAFTAGDFDGDGGVDLAGLFWDASTVGGADSVRILAGDNKGAFTQAGRYAVGELPSAIVTGDFNGDNLPDLAFSNDYSDTIGVMSGLGHLAFEAQVTFDTESFPSGVAAADFANDGVLDIATAQSGSVAVPLHEVGVFMNTTP